MTMILRRTNIAKNKKFKIIKRKINKKILKKVKLIKRKIFKKILKKIKLKIQILIRIKRFNKNLELYK